MIDLHGAPWYLIREDDAWVTSTLAGMTQEEKIGQLFCLTGVDNKPETLRQMVKKHQPGAWMHRAAPAKELLEANRVLQESSRLPMLIAANLESGGNGVAVEGTHFGKQMGIAATSDVTMAERLGGVCGREGTALGCNWAFAPIVDIDNNWRNPITNVRTYGSDAETVLHVANGYIRGMKVSCADMAYCIKHFPGDGVDERDQHLTPTVNSLSADQWRQTYGHVYKALIKGGAMTLMVGHILQPALVLEKHPGTAVQDMLPASISRVLMTEVLRGDLNYQGLIVTDATPMLGFSAMRPRSECLRLAIAGGADMILFTKDAEEDYAAIREGLRTGEITQGRLDEAVTRVLAAKASLRLPQKKRRGELVPSREGLSVLSCPQHEAWAQACADASVTLVKDTQQLLPVSPERMPRVRLTILGEHGSGAFGDNETVGGRLKDELEKRGFTVHVYDEATLEQGEIFTDGVQAMKGKFDLSIIAANVATGSNNTTRRLEWITLMAANAPWYVRDIPTLLVSFANPYHLVDAPYISTYVNCYSNNRFCVSAFVNKLVGESEFRGVSPVDPFAGIWGAKEL